MRGFLLALTAVVLGAGALSIMILPSREELGTMYLRDHRYEESRALFERQIADGDLSAQTVSALLSIYLQYGDVDRAIDLTRRYGDEIGDQPALLERLAQLYASDQRLGLYRRTMERLVAVAPTGARLEDLADSYLRAADRPGRANALRRLVDSGQASPERMLEYADLSLAMGRADDTLEALLLAAEKTPAALDWSYRALTVELLLHQHRLDEAETLTNRWLDGATPVAFLISFSQLWMEAGDPERAVAILGGHPSLEATSEAWRAAYILDLQRAGHSDYAFTRLSKWLDQGLVTPALSVDFIGLAVSHHELDMALTAFDRTGADAIPLSAVLLLVSALHQANRQSDVDRVVAALGPDRMAALPVLAAEIALARGDRAAARAWVDVALSDAMISVDDRLALSSVLIGLGDDDEAFRLLAVIAESPAPPTEALVLLGEIYARRPDPEDGYWEISSLLARLYTPQLRAVWAELALATGRDREVRDWLDLTKEIDSRTLDNLFYIAERRQSWVIAILAARRMLELQPSDLSRERLAVALLRGGQAAEALAVLDGVARRSQSQDGLYVDILQSLGLTDRLVALWQEQIAQPGIDAARLRELVYNLLGAGADAAAWPHLMDLAGREGGSWWFALAETAVRLGRGSIAADAVAAAITDLPADDERLPGLLAALDTAAHERVPDSLRRLADLAPSLWADGYAVALRERGRTADLNRWLSERLKASRDPSEALTLAQRLAETAAPLDAARTIRPRAAAGRDWTELYVDLLRRGQRSKEAMEFLVGLALKGGIDPQWRREIAFQALESGNREAADRLFRALAATEPPDGPSVRQLFFLWGPRPEAAALDWVEARARAARGPERSAWLEHLLAVRAGDRVISIIGDVAGASGPAEVELVVRAKAQSPRPEQLREAVTAAVDRTRDVATLVRFARTAETTRDRKLIADSWRAVLAAEPDHPTANRELGMIAYDEGRLVDAERRLRTFLAQGDGDHEANYFFGEVLFRTGRKDQAGPYYQRAYDQLSALPRRDFGLDVARANILRRLGRRDAAADLMADLLDRRPKDRALRADFADLLIEIGDFERARYVLQLR